jgi:hypothetical protein
MRKRLCFGIAGVVCIWFSAYSRVRSCWEKFAGSGCKALPAPLLAFHLIFKNILE